LSGLLRNIFRYGIDNPVGNRDDRRLENPIIEEC
jgi:hypothetical protein